MDQPLESILAYRECLKELLLKHGAVLLRGFAPQGARAFAKWVSNFSARKLLSYRGGASPRVEVARHVYTSTEYPASYELSLHNEMSYTYNCPANLYFYCVQPASAGGATPIADSRVLLQAIDGEIVDEFKSKKIRYVRQLNGNAGSGYSWQDAFETRKRSVVEDYCRRGEIKCEWFGSTVRLTETRPATCVHPATGEEVWFNQADNFNSMVNGQPRLSSCFADGTPFPARALAGIRQAMKKEMVAVEWRRGDLLILDNILAAHGREPFTGARRILLAMT
jgi:alpha-ketoglutarate-dependent taurine dioxygenase